MVDHDTLDRHFEFFRDQHRYRRVDALPHLDLGNHERHLARAVDLHERVRREHAVLRRFDTVAAHHRSRALSARRALPFAGRGKAEAEHQPAARRRAHCEAELEERAPGDAALVRVPVLRIE
jgi:hypothetical protein